MVEFQSITSNVSGRKNFAISSFHDVLTETGHITSVGLKLRAIVDKHCIVFPRPMSSALRPPRQDRAPPVSCLRLISVCSENDRTELSMHCGCASSRYVALCFPPHPETSLCGDRLSTILLSAAIVEIRWSVSTRNSEYFQSNASTCFRKCIRAFPFYLSSARYAASKRFHAEIRNSIRYENLSSERVCGRTVLLLFHPAHASALMTQQVCVLAQTSGLCWL